MATRLDLDEQEQLDRLKHLWKQYGNLVTWTLILALGGYAAFNGWAWYQRDRAGKAGMLYDQLDEAAKAGDADRAARAFADLKERYGGTAFAEQGGLLAAKVQFDKGQADAAQATLGWVAEHADEAEYRVIARLRLAALLLDQGKSEEALGQLPSDAPAAFVGLVADRRGDILATQGKRSDAGVAYRSAYEAMDADSPYRRVVEAKLDALGASPSLPVAASAPASGASQ